jgi:hypothetical protein
MPIHPTLTYGCNSQDFNLSDIVCTVTGREERGTSVIADQRVNLTSGNTLHIQECLWTSLQDRFGLCNYPA